MWVNVLPACMYVHRMPACWIPGTAVLEGCEPSSYGCWASNQVLCKSTSALDYWAISPIPWEDILMCVYTLAYFFPGDFTLNVAWHDKHSYFTSSLGVWVCRGFKTDFLPMSFSLVWSPEASPWDISLFPVLWEKCFLQAELLLSLFRSLFHMILAFWCRLLLSWGPLGNTSCNSRSYTCNSSSIKHSG